LYEVLTNELGIQFSKGNWRAADIAIFRTEQLQSITFHNKYVPIPPEVVIEVDTKADIEQFVTSMDYYYSKTDALLAFGVKKVIWIYTDARKILIAESQKDWITTNWEADIHLIDNVSLNLSKLLSNCDFMLRQQSL
jgi:Uma2 family endonuclease